MQTENQQQLSMETIEEWKNTIHHKGLSIICIAKNGTTSIRDAFLRAQGIEKPVVDFSDLDCYFPFDAPGHRVCFIRNPIERAYSCWASKLKDKTVSERSRHLIKAGFTVGCTFDAFVKDLETKRHLDKHTDEQWKYVENYADEYYRFEDINQRWKVMQGFYSWLPALRLLNKTSEPKVINPDTRKKLKRIYHCDYSFWRELGR